MPCNRCRTPAFATCIRDMCRCLVDFDPLAVTHDEIAGIVGRQSISWAGFALSDGGKAVEIPVCYDAEFGPDLQDVAAHTRIAR